MAENERLATTGISGILLKIAQPDMYLKNGFRVLGISVDATGRDISRHAQIVKTKKLYGNGITEKGVMPLPTPPEEETISESIQRLFDPPQRIVDEFFWFWPHQLGASKSDDALLALAQNDTGAAVKIWNKQEKEYSECHVSFHNLAVFTHLWALDFENRSLSKKLTDEESKTTENYWQRSFERWKLLFDNEECWSRLSARIRELNDPRLTTGTSRRIRESLPLTLLLINARLAVRAAEGRRMADATRQLKIMKNSGFGQDVISAALYNATQPVRDRIKALCENSESESDKNPERADKTARNLAHYAIPLLNILNCLFPANHPIPEGLRDMVALRILICQVTFANKTEDWKTSKELLELARPIAISKSTCSKIEENIEIVKNILVYGICWFCGENKADLNVAIPVQMYGNVRPVLGTTQIEYQYGAVKVPRCTFCKDIHHMVGRYKGVGSVIGAVIGCFGREFFLVTIPLGCVIFNRIGYIISMKTFSKDIKSINSANNFSGVQQRIAEGWKFGLRPPTN